MAIQDAALQAPTAVSLGPPFAPMWLNRPLVATRSPLKVAVLNARGGADFHAILACLYASATGRYGYLVTVRG